MQLKCQEHVFYTHLSLMFCWKFIVLLDYTQKHFMYNINISRAAAWEKKIMSPKIHSRFRLSLVVYLGWFHFHFVLYKLVWYCYNIEIGWSCCKQRCHILNMLEASGSYNIFIMLVVFFYDTNSDSAKSLKIKQQKH